MDYDLVIIGAGAAGLFCAGVAGQRGLKVLLLDHSERVAQKVRISGGGRCNFNNREVSPANFISENPHFCRSALSRYTPADFLQLLHKHGVAFYEKHKGQLFCQRSSDDIIQLLLRECDAGGVTRWQPCRVQGLRTAQVQGADGYAVDSDRGAVLARKVVVATGGLSIPKIGASDLGYRIAAQFGLGRVPTAPALVPLSFDGAAWQPYAQLCGLSLPVRIATGGSKGGASFAEDLLFTHRGLSGPAVLQISSFWKERQPISLNLAPSCDLNVFLAQAKRRSRRLIANELAAQLPSRLADAWVRQDPAWQRSIDQATDKALSALARALQGWELTPTGTEGYGKAEVTRGGIDTRDLSSQTMESKQPGLYFIGEVVDVTGWLGGYNFQWAWARGHACAQALAGGQS
ncbi:MAG: NAD(P)/FAD-dependent oxidoreductase [Betaproteobacteria bacterium]